jgi:hypothetical protein
MNSFDLVTVVFAEELPVLKVQAQSIEKYCGKLNIGKIIVVVNDNEDVQVDTNWYGKHKDRVVVINRSKYGNFNCDGWVSQQILKIFGSAEGSSKWSIVLDAKTIFVSTIDPTVIFDVGGRIRSGSIPIYPVFYPSKKLVEELFDIEINEVIGPSGVPFFFHNQTVREMIIDIESRSNQTFSQYFQDKGMITEFMLYSAYVKHRYGPVNHLYGGYFDYKVVNVCHSEVAVFDEKFKDMHHDNVLTVSVHRNAWKHLSQQQQQDYRNLLLEKKLESSHL